MVSLRSLRGDRKQKKSVEIIELLSDSEADISEHDETSQQAGMHSQPDAQSRKSAKLPVRVKDTGSARHRHVSIEIPLPTSSMLARDDGDGREIPDSDEADEEEDFKTPMEKGKRIVFDDSDRDEFVTPMEAPLRNPLENSLSSPSGPPRPSRQAGKDSGSVQADGDQEAKEDDDEEQEESDDEAPPEAVSSHAAGAQIAKAARAAARAAEQ